MIFPATPSKSLESLNLEMKHQVEQIFFCILINKLLYFLCNGALQPTAPPGDSPSFGWSDTPYGASVRRAHQLRLICFRTFKEKYMGKVFLLIIFYMNTNLASVQTIQQDVSSMGACENIKMQILKDLEDEASASKVKLAKCYLSK